MRSLDVPGLEYQFTMTSKPFPQKSTSELGLWLEVHPASQSRAPEKDWEKKMTASSGKRLSRLFSKSDPLGAFSKILLHSEQWGSIEFLMKWKLITTPQGRSVFQLAPSVRRTDASDTGLFAGAWMTPNVMEQLPPKSAKALAHELEHRQGRTQPNNLRDQLNVNMGGASWPTPASRDINGQTQNPERMDYVPNILKATWPTPQEHDRTGKRGKNNTFSDAHYYPHDLPTATSAWATPNQNATSGGPCRPEGRKGHSGEVIDQLHQTCGTISSGCLARTEKFVVRLMVLSAWLMAIPIPYLLNWPKSTGRRSGRSATRSSGPSQQE